MPHLTATAAKERPAVPSPRERNVATIRSLFGTDTRRGRELLNLVLAKHVLELLSDDAIAELAQLHREAAAERKIRCRMAPGDE